MCPRDNGMEARIIARRVSEVSSRFAVWYVQTAHVVKHVIDIFDAVFTAFVHPGIKRGTAEGDVRVQRDNLCGDAEHLADVFWWRATHTVLGI